MKPILVRIIESMTATHQSLNLLIWHGKRKHCISCWCTIIYILYYNRVFSISTRNCATIAIICVSIYISRILPANEWKEEFLSVLHVSITIVNEWIFSMVKVLRPNKLEIFHSSHPLRLFTGWGRVGAYKLIGTRHIHILFEKLFVSLPVTAN